MLLSLAIWLQRLKLFESLRESSHGYEILLSLHLSFISLFAAMVVVTDLRLLGWRKSTISLPAIIDQLRVPKRIGFILVATCGFLLFGMKAEEYYYNAFFRVKLLLFILLVIHALAFRRSVYSNTAQLDDMNQPSRQAKVAAALSLFLWLCIVSAGRGIGYIPPPPSTHHFTMLFR